MFVSSSKETYDLLEGKNHVTYSKKLYIYLRTPSSVPSHGNFSVNNCQNSTTLHSLASNTLPTKWFAAFIPFNLYNNQMRKALLLELLVIRWGNWNLQRLWNSPQITQLVKGKARPETWPVWAQGPGLWPLSGVAFQINKPTHISWLIRCWMVGHEWALEAHSWYLGHLAITR